MLDPVLAAREGVSPSLSLRHRVTARALLLGFLLLAGMAVQTATGVRALAEALCQTTNQGTPVCIDGYMGPKVLPETLLDISTYVFDRYEGKVSAGSRLLSAVGGGAMGAATWVVELGLSDGTEHNDDQAAPSTAIDPTGNTTPQRLWGPPGMTLAWVSGAVVSHQSIQFRLVVDGGHGRYMSYRIDRQCRNTSSNVVTSDYVMSSGYTPSYGPASSTATYSCPSGNVYVGYRLRWLSKTVSPSPTAAEIDASGATLFEAGTMVTPVAPTDPDRTGTPYSRCADSSGAQLVVYGPPVTFRDSDLPGGSGTLGAQPSFTLPACPASHPIRMGWGVQPDGDHGPDVDYTAAPVPLAFPDCADYSCEVVTGPTASGDCYTIAPDGTVTQGPGPCEPTSEGDYCTWGPYNLQPSECEAAPRTSDLEQDDCMPGFGWDMLQPWKWIPSITRCLFVPDQAFMDDLGSDLGGAWDASAPGAATGMIGDLISPFAALPTSKGSCEGPPVTLSLPMAGETTLSPFNACLPLIDLVLTYLMPVMSVGLYLATLWRSVDMLQGSLGVRSL